MQRSPKAERSVLCPAVPGSCPFSLSALCRLQSATSEFRVASGSGNYAHKETDKARTLRTKHGPLGCGGRRRRAPHRRCTNDNLVVVNRDPIVSPMSAWTLPPQRAVRALSAVSVLCPFLPGRRILTRRVGSLRARRCRGLVPDRCSRRARLRHPLPRVANTHYSVRI